MFRGIGILPLRFNEERQAGSLSHDVRRLSEAAAVSEHTDGLGGPSYCDGPVFEGRIPHGVRYHTPVPHCNGCTAWPDGAVAAAWERGHIERHSSGVG